MLEILYKSNMHFVLHTNKAHHVFFFTQIKNMHVLEPAF